MRFVAIQFAALFLFFTVAVSTASTAFAECSCKTGRWVTLGVSSTRYTAASCSEMFNEAREFDNARGVRFNGSAGQCSLCFGSNWQCKRKRASAPKKPVKKIETKSAPSIQKPPVPRLPKPVITAEAPALRGAVKDGTDLCDGQRQWNMAVASNCLLHKQVVNRAAKGDPEFSMQRLLSNFVLASRG